MKRRFDPRSQVSHQIAHLSLRPSTISKLQRRGFITSADVFASKQTGGLSTFATEVGLSLVEASSIYREVEKAVKALSNHSQEENNETPKTAASILTAQYSNQSGFVSRPIISFAQSIDSLLGGGIQPNEVTEIVGAPSSGKTQLAMQLCVDTTLPKQFGGVEGEAIFIDTEGSFAPDRCMDMASALYEHLQGSVQRSNGKQSLPSDYCAEKILDSIHVYRIFDETTQTATIRTLSIFIENMKNKGRFIKLLAIDSIAFHYRASTTDYKSRSKNLARTASMLSDIASKYDIAVVVINQMTTKIYNRSNDENGGKSITDGNSSLVPALGESWSHAVTTRLLLLPDNGSLGNSFSNDRHKRRMCKLVKSPHKPSGTALFSITEFGIRGTM